MVKLAIRMKTGYMDEVFPQDLEIFSWGNYLISLIYVVEYLKIFSSHHTSEHPCQSIFWGATFKLGSLY